MFETQLQTRASSNLLYLTPYTSFLYDKLSCESYWIYASCNEKVTLDTANFDFSCRRSVRSIKRN
jgi:hypothetical protein